jgi:demethylmenaquinone methyltransferase/2-methoxy-6-polyprenyl-1,4-benzoquinol methylase
MIRVLWARFGDRVTYATKRLILRGILKRLLEAGMHDYYARRAEEYDAIYDKPERQASLRRMEAWLAQKLAGQSVLEIACGTGYWTQFIARQAHHVTALDMSSETLAVARSKPGVAQVQFMVADAYDLPSLPVRFSAAFAGFWFSHVPKAQQAGFLHGLNARLTPGAQVVLMDNLYVPGSSTPIAHTDPSGDTYQARALRDGSSHLVLKNFPDEAQLHAVLSDAGLDVRYTTWPYYWAAQYTVR